MNAANRSKVVGRRLRRFLGALLAVGFGAAWWSFVPRASVAEAAPPPPVAVDGKPRVGTPVVKVLVVPAVIVVPIAPEPPVKRHIVANPKPVAVTTVVPTYAVPPPARPVRPPPVVEPPTPVVEPPTPPAVDDVPHVVDDPPVVVDDPPRVPLPRIRTRSS